MVDSEANSDNDHRDGLSIAVVVERLANLGLAMPQVARPSRLFVPALTVGATVFTSGQVPVRNGFALAQGVVGVDVDLATAQECARQCILNGLAAICDEVGDLMRVGITKLLVYVACAPGFTEQSAVADAASGLLLDIFGDNGIHVRSAVGVASLPRGVPVEIELTGRVRP